RCSCHAPAAFQKRSSAGLFIKNSKIVRQSVAIIIALQFIRRKKKPARKSASAFRAQKRSMVNQEPKPQNEQGFCFSIPGDILPTLAISVDITASSGKAAGTRILLPYKCKSRKPEDGFRLSNTTNCCL
ncbi:MAG: hypothetical protein MR828_13755, partial [Clostridiales bacterium]|nr:hypothetical protein [Clostridiales bacterium]